MLPIPSMQRLRSAVIAVAVLVALGPRLAAAEELTLSAPSVDRWDAPAVATPLFARPETAALLPIGATPGTGPDVDPLPTDRFEPPATARVAPAEPATTATAAPAPIGSGRATFYQHEGRTASGERFDPDGHTAAHASLPLGSRVRVLNRGNGRSVVVRINDRTSREAQARHGFLIDLSRGSARAIGIEDVGTVALYRVD